MSDDERAPSSVDLRGVAPTAAVARNAFYLVLGQVGTTVLAIVLSAALARSLGAADFGLYYLITTMAAFAYVFAEWGQPFFVIRQAVREPPRSGDLLGTALALRTGLALLVTIPAALVGWALGYGTRTTLLAVLLILASLPLFLAQGYGMVFRADNRMGREAAVAVSNKLIALCIALPVLALGAGISGVILAQAIAGGMALGVAYKLYRQLEKPALRVTSLTARELMTGGAPILAMTAASALQPYLDATILSRLAPAAVVGWFAAAKNILGTLTAPAVILAAAAYPGLARASVDTGALKREIRSVLRPLLWLGALAGTGTYLFASTVVGLIYGTRGYGPATTILVVFAPGFFLLFIDILLGNVIWASGGGSGFAMAKVGSVVVGTALDFALIPFFQDRYGNGGIGVVVAFALSELVVFAAALFVIRKGTLDAGTALDMGRALGAAAATVVLFRFLPSLPPWVGMPLCIGFFAVASVALGLIGREDLAVLHALFRRRRAAVVPAAEPVL